MPCALFFLFGSSGVGEFVNQSLWRRLLFGFGLRLLRRLVLF
jgi:hypothetical protein